MSEYTVKQKSALMKAHLRDRLNIVYGSNSLKRDVPLFFGYAYGFVHDYMCPNWSAERAIIYILAVVYRLANSERTAHTPYKIYNEDICANYSKILEALTCHVLELPDVDVDFLGMPCLD